MSPQRPTVVVVEDNDTMRKLLVAELSQDPSLRIEHAANGTEGLQKAASPECTVVVLDLMLPDMDGLQFIERLRKIRSNTPSIIAMTAASPIALPDAVIEAPYRGLVSAIFRKPFDHQKMRETVGFCART